MQSWLKAIEIGKQRDVEAGDVSELEEEAQAEAEEIAQETLRFLRLILRASSRPRPELPIYDGSLVAENIMDLINDLDKYFE